MKTRVKTHIANTKKSEGATSTGHGGNIMESPYEETSPLTRSTEAEATGSTDSAKNVVVVFEGGGAKGITHVGALKALENAGLQIVGVAGTSAGAIVAALVAVGYRADDIFDPNGGDILERLGTSPLQVVGTWRWWAFRFLFGWSSRAAALVPATSIFLMVGAFLGIGQVWGVALATMLVLQIAIPTTLAAWLWLKLGVLTTDGVRSVVDLALHKRLSGRGDTRSENRPVTFEDLQHGGGTDLKIVTSEITSGELRLFDRRTGKVPIGEAVAASTAIPLAFRPVRISGSAGEEIHVDGGLVSNLPCWVFHESAIGITDTGSGEPLVIAFTLGRGAPRRRYAFMRWCGRRFGALNFGRNGAVAPGHATPSAPRRGRIEGHLLDIFETGVFGSQGVVRRLIPGLQVIPLNSTLSTYDFDCDREDAVRAYRRGCEEASAALAELAETGLFGPPRDAISG